ncbi:hypothetical protein J6590_084575 [Homalodisca vitripennis]|nr:hypothetical protein J6590_084575 [Homalodisca vitripennis]
MEHEKISKERKKSCSYGQFPALLILRSDQSNRDSWVGRDGDASAKLRTEVDSPVSVPRQLPSLVKTSEVRAKKPSLTLKLGTSEPPRRAGGLLARTGSLSGHPSKQQPRSTLLDLCGSFKLPASIDRQLFVMESVIAKVLLPEPLSISARLILSYKLNIETVPRGWTSGREDKRPRTKNRWWTQKFGLPEWRFIDLTNQ